MCVAADIFRPATLSLSASEFAGDEHGNGMSQI